MTAIKPPTAFHAQVLENYLALRFTWPVPDLRESLLALALAAAQAGSPMCSQLVANRIRKFKPLLERN